MGWLFKYYAWVKPACRIVKVKGYIGPFSTFWEAFSECNAGFPAMAPSGGNTVKAVFLYGKQQPVQQEIRQIAWDWIDHTLSRTDGRIAKRVLERNPKGSTREAEPSTPGCAQEWQSWGRDSSHGGK